MLKNPFFFHPLGGCKSQKMGKTTPRPPKQNKPFKPPPQSPPVLKKNKNKKGFLGGKKIPWPPPNYGQSFFPFFLGAFEKVLGVVKPQSKTNI